MLNYDRRREAEVKARLGDVGFEAFSSTPGELGDFVKVQLSDGAE